MANAVIKPKRIKPKRKKLRSIAKLTTDLQKLVNLYARLRDCNGTGGAKCISCQVWYPFAKLHGGHFIPVGGRNGSSMLRFDPANINGQCGGCNYRLHGNQMYYQDGMIAKWGQAMVDYLKSEVGKSHKWARIELEVEIKWYKEKIEEMKQ